jgi:hypothetical protein
MENDFSDFEKIILAALSGFLMFLIMFLIIKKEFDEK